MNSEKLRRLQNALLYRLIQRCDHFQFPAYDLFDQSHTHVLTRDVWVPTLGAETARALQNHINTEWAARQWRFVIMPLGLRVYDLRVILPDDTALERFLSGMSVHTTPRRR